MSLPAADIEPCSGNKLHQGNLAGAKIAVGAEIYADGEDRVAQIALEGGSTSGAFSWGISHGANGRVENLRTSDPRCEFPIMSQIAPPVLVDLLARLKHPDHTGQP